MDDNKPSILYVDDEEFNLTSFKAIFRREYNVFTATSGKIGLDILKKEDISLIITDQRMPDMTGVEFLETIAEEYMYVRRIIITGFSDIEAIIRAINKGNIYRYITKPWDVNDLRITIANAIMAYKTDKQNRDLAIELQKKLNKIEELTEEQIRLKEEKFKQEAEKKILEAESAKLKEIQKIREEISGMIVHDLKNPLGLVLGYAKMATDLIEKPELNKETLIQFIRAMEQAGHNMLTLVLNILDVYRFENGIPSLKISEVSIDEILHSSLEKVKFGLEKKELELVTRIDLKSKLQVDKELISRVLVNLLTNAIKYSQKTKRIWIDIKPVNHHLECMVKDEGLGIPAEKMKQLFSRFNQVDAKDDAQGIKSSGIGLTFVKYAVEAHEGQVWVESEEGKGSSFYFSLPLHTQQ